MRKACLPRLQKVLTANGFKINPIRYKAHGFLVGVGFDAIKDDRVKLEVEPKGRKEYFVSFKNGESCHYSIKRDGFQPVMTRHISKLIPDIREFFNIKNNTNV